MRLLTSFLFGAFGTFLSSQADAAMPKSEVLLADLETPYGMKVTRITDNKSYNNQPFLIDEGLYYTHEVLGDDGQSQTDLYFYNFTTQQATNLTHSAVSEYSPTLMPNKQALSAIVVEEDGKQKLWQYPLQGEQSAARIFEWIEPVGYHAWGADNDLVMFILGEPHTLQYTTVAAAKPKVVANAIGRTLLFDAQTNSYLFSYHKDKQHWLARFTPQFEQVTDILRLPAQLQDFTLFDEQTVIYAINNRVYKRDLMNSEPVSQWLDLTSYCETKITRLSYHNKKLAFVCDK